MKAVRLRTEYLKEPVGIDLPRPRLQWNCAGSIRQTAYEIVARDDGGRLLWSSGKVTSRSMHACWDGKPLAAQTKVIWKVRLWDEEDTCGEWSESTFETGIGVWQAKWITGDYKMNKNQRYAVDCFRKCFEAESVAKARLYITACGAYEAKINGVKAGDFVLAPGHTDYRKRVQYQAYDVTGLLKDGENQLTVQLADGWYRGSCGAWGLKNQYGTETKLLAQLQITRTDGAVQTVISDESWAWSDDGPIRFADNKDGEVVDAGSSPSYRGRAKVTDHTVVPSASNNVPVTEQERFSAVLIRTPAGKTVLDFGQNIAGYVSFRVQAKAGQKLYLRFGELLDGDGEFTQKNIQCSNDKITTPLQQVIYTCKEGLNEYKTTFAIFGFRYVQVEAELTVDPADFAAIAVYSAMERTGFFDSSNDLLNRFVEATVWSAKGNSCDVPTDCPTRERHGWSGDAQIFCSTASFLFDYRAFAGKYLQDLYDWQKKDGKLPQIAPEGGTDFYMKAMDGSVGWADAGVIMPYVLWKQYGDPQILRQFIGGMRKYASFMQNRCGKWHPTAPRTGLRGKDRKFLSNCGQAYGEWAEPADVHTMTWKDCAVPHPEVATAYTAYVMDLMAEIETALGNPQRAEDYAAFGANCRRSYQALVRQEGYSLDTDRQAKLVRPLYFDLLDEKQAVFARERLIRALENYGWRLGTGFLSTPLILDVLTQIDPEAAYRLLENEEMPGWLFMPKNGATTVWEAWEGNATPKQGIASLNHYSKGAVCRWLFDTMCGIRVDGENRFTIAPVPGGSFTHAAARYQSVYGMVESKWERGEKGTCYTVSVPANCEAEVTLPEKAAQILGPGTYTFTFEEES